MSNGSVMCVWRAALPREWPSRPRRMSVSRLLDIENCPRRWALSSAAYPDVWGGRGYPERPNPRAVAGSVVHRAIELITNALASTGCTSVEDRLFYSVLKSLGGYTKVINGCILDVLSAYDGNPRAEHYCRALTTQLQNQVSEFRERVQAFIGRLQLLPKEIATDSEATEKRGSDCGAGRRARVPVINGSYTEFPLSLGEHGWVGYADLINVSDEGCEIVDFKTGTPQPEHAFQLRAYNLMWVRDRVANPAGKGVDRLTLAYPDQEVNVPPLTPAEVESFEAELLERERAALTLLKDAPPPAIPSVRNCTFCPVRQMCKEYWEPDTQKQLAAQRMIETKAWGQHHVDFEIDITGPQGATSYKADVRVGAGLNPGSRVIVRPSRRDSPFQAVLSAGRRVRLIDAHLEDVGDEPDAPPVIVIGAGSEAFLVE